MANQGHVSIIPRPLFFRKDSQGRRRAIAARETAVDEDAPTRRRADAPTRRRSTASGALRYYKHDDVCARRKPGELEIGS